MVRLLVVPLAALTGAAAPPAAARWSAPASPAGCATARAGGPPPQVVFPSYEPTAASGAGALLWSAPRGCGAPGTQALAAGALLAADDRPGRGRPLSATVGLATVASATGTAEGQVVAVGTASDAAGLAGAGGAGVTAAGGASVTAAGGAVTAATGGAGAYAEGSVGSFSPAQPLGGPAAPVAVASAYLGDVVVASPAWTPRTGWALAVRAQRHYNSVLGSPRLIPTGARPVAVAAALDYRAEVLLVWVVGGSVYECELAQAGTRERVRRLGVLPAGTVANPEVQALLSDDGHAIVAWRSYAPTARGETLTTLDLSRFGVGVGAPAPPAPTVVERSRAPGPPPGALRLVRLSSEAVVMAWTGRAADRYVVRASPVSLRRGAWAPVTISGASREDATLADLAAGPAAEALAVWRATPPRTGAGGRPRAGGRTGAGARADADGTGVAAALLAARGHYAGHGEVAFEAPEEVAPPGLHTPPAAAIDPRTGQAVAAWVTRPSGALAGRVVYAVRAPGSASAPTAPAATAPAAPSPPTPASHGAPARAVSGARAHPALRAATGGGRALLPALLAALGVLLAAVAGWRVAAHRPGRHVRTRQG